MIHPQLFKSIIILILRYDVIAVDTLIIQIHPDQSIFHIIWTQNIEPKKTTGSSGVIPTDIQMQHKK